MVNTNCFISYSWDDDEHKNWIRDLATELQNNGIMTYLDQWDVHPGMDVTNYMETHIRESDFVLLICTPIFSQKANAGLGGVGYEKSIVTGEIFEDIASPIKFVPILRKGDAKESLPSYLKSRVFIDFQNNDEFESSMDLLIRHLFQSPKYPRPPLGQKPDALTQEIKPLKITAKPEIVHPISKLNTFKQVFDFAYDSNGLDKYRSAAELYAKDWLSTFSETDFRLFKEIFEFAYDSNGLDKYRSGAEKYARDWLTQFTGKDFILFKKVFEFAYDSNGLDKYRSGAEKYARDWLSTFSEMDFNIFKETFDFAYDPKGLDKYRSEAEKYAMEWIMKS